MDAWAARTHAPRMTCRSSKAASPHMVRPIRPSRICQARGPSQRIKRHYATQVFATQPQGSTKGFCAPIATISPELGASIRRRWSHRCWPAVAGRTGARRAAGRAAALAARTFCQCAARRTHPQSSLRSGGTNRLNRRTGRRRTPATDCAAGSCRGRGPDSNTGHSCCAHCR